MNARRGGLLLLLFIFCCHIVGLLLFCKGFLLKRVVISEYSQCTQENTGPQAHLEKRDTHSGPSCNVYPRKFKRVVWLLIDAWRYDFAVFDETLDPVPVYRNKMPFVRDLLREKPENAKLFRFVADPPTTTMQRLKALTTGGLPTFIDVSNNFNSYEILEDSLPYQSKANGRSVTFMGDDTWLGLYPSMLTKVFDYPSLNVKDLHTVDDGVTAHLIPELELYDAELVIGHFLGVDHVGHTYGPSHPTMGDKLAQMDEVLKSVFAAVDNETIVFVLGDHGMTSTGDHGGETELETNAALLVYSPRPLFDPHQSSGRPLFQIDLVPTVALALGMPIPFSNLGMIIPEVFLPYKETPHQSRGSPNGYEGRVTLEFLTALRINAKQVQKYLQTYIQHSDDFPTDVYQSLEQKLNRAESLHERVLLNDGRVEEDLTRFADGYVEYMKEVKRMCQSVWAKFDDVPINQGLFILALSISTSILMLLDMEHSINALQKALTLGVITGCIVSMASFIVHQPDLELSPSSLISLITSLGSCSLTIVSVLYLWHMRKTVFGKLKIVFLHQGISMFSNLSFLQIIAFAIFILYGISLLSNSFILYEGDVVIFFLQTMVICFALRRLQRELPIKKSRECNYFVIQVLRTLAPFALLMVCIRLTKLFHSCRDLQVGCEATTFILALPTALEILGVPAKLRFLASSLGTCLVPVTLIVLLRKVRASRHLQYRLLAVVQYGVPVASLCVCAFWALQALPQSSLNSLPSWQHVFLPRVVYCVSVATAILSILQPFREKSTLVLREAANGSEVEEPSEQNVRLRRGTSNCNEEGEKQSSPVNADSTKRNQYQGPHLDTIRLLPVVIILVALWLSMAMLLNDGIALSAILMVIQVALFFTALQKSEEGSSWPVIVFWSLMCCQYFFGFGHHATLTSLRFEAAFVGLHGEITPLNQPVAGLQVGLNTLASQILFGLGLPLLLLLKNPRCTDKAPSLHRKLLEIGLQYISFHSLKVVVAVIAASLHRRHLMIWGVFSPRFMYEGAFQATTDFCVILATALFGLLEGYTG